MRIILATGIYPPDIGGPATYTQALAKQLTKQGHTVEVVTYAATSQGVEVSDGITVHTVASTVPVLRWWWYSQKLQEVAKDADVVYAFSSISCGIPLILSGVRSKRVLRLGGDFFWERYTDLGGKKSLAAYYTTPAVQLLVFAMQWIMNRFDYVVFSTDFQQQLYKEAYRKLPDNTVIENALSLEQVVPMKEHYLQDPLRLLFVGRFVGFKNLCSLVEAVAQIPNAFLTLVGDGPLDDALRRLVERLGLTQRVQFAAPLHGKEKFALFDHHDLLVLPSLTEISPNVALEARSSGLPVLLTEQTGLSAHLRSGIVTEDLSTPGKIVEAIERVRKGYSLVAEAASQKIAGRSWEEVTLETLDLFATISNQ